METSYLDPFIETLGRNALTQIQIKKLQLMLGEVLKSNEFYRRKLKDAGLDDPSDIRTLDDMGLFKRLPFTTKQELSAD